MNTIGHVNVSSVKIGVWLLYDAVFISAVQGSESATCMHMPPSGAALLPHAQPSHPSGEHQAELPAMQQLPASYLVYDGKVHRSTPLSSIHPTPPFPNTLQYPQVCSLSVSLFLGK